MVVRILSSIYFTKLGVRELYLGYLNYLGLPWNLKFLWAPLLDAVGTKKGWQVCLQSALALLMVCVGALSYIAGGSSDPQSYLPWIAWAFVLMAFLSATNDIAIDGFYLEALPQRSDQALLSGYRVLAYRLSMVFARSGLVFLVPWCAARMTHNTPYHAWAVPFVVAGGVLFALAMFHWSFLPSVAPARGAEEGQGRFGWAKQVFVEGFRTYVAQPKVGLILAFIILYKLGDEILFSMVTPFLTRELGVSLEQYAWIGGIVGAAGTIVGAMIGGWWIQRVGLRRALWPLSLLMNLNILLYVWLAAAKPDPTTVSGLSIITTIHAIEQLAAGLGSAALLVFLLTTCSKEYRATHYAVGSAIMSIPGTLIGGQAGGLVEWIGYTNLYIIAFVAAIPGMCLIPFVPIRDE